MDDYLSKPVSLKALAAALGKISTADASAASPPPPSPPGAPAVLNRDAALERFDGDENLYQMVCKEFPLRCREVVDALRQAKERDDRETFARLVHTFKSNCGLIGAEAGMEIAKRLFEVVQAGDMAETDRFFTRLEEEFDRILAVLAGM